MRLMPEAFSEKEIQDYRKLFPVTRNWIYLNHAGVAPLHTRAADAAEAFLREALSEGYTAAGRWAKDMDRIRGQCARLIGAKTEEIAFVKNTSHGLSLIARGLNLQAGDEVILSDIEFPTNVYPWMALESRGVVIKKIPARNGKLDLQVLPRLFSPKTKVLSLSTVQYGNGFRLPVEAIGKLCRERSVLFCLDAIQSLGAFPLDVVKGHVDFLSADAHKWLLGPEGIGILYVRAALLDQVEPLLLGWNSVAKAHDFDHIDFKLRPTAERYEEGSQNLMSVYALGACVDLILEVGVPRIAERILLLTGRLIDGLQNLGLPLTCSLDPPDRSGIVTFQWPQADSLARLQKMERHLFGKKIYGAIRRESLRLSPHFYNDEGEIDRTLAEIGSAYHAVR